MTALSCLRPVWLLVLAVVAGVVTGCQRQPAATSEVAPATSTAATATATATATASAPAAPASPSLPSPSASAVQAASDWTWDLPDYLPPPRVPADNPMTQAKVALGRYLFYDTRLSGNGTQACTTCHLQKLAFTDGRAHGLGSTGQLHPRSPMALGNVGWNATYTWANPALITLERQMTNPIFGETPVEMGVNDRNVKQILQRLADDPAYAPRFAAAFPQDPAGRPTWDHIVKAVSSFERALITTNSKYDQVRQGRARYTASEARGYALFKSADCIKCHQEPNFGGQFLSVATVKPDVSFHNKGLYNLDGQGAYPAESPGVIEITGKASDMGMYRAPTLRNIELTAPYMHDGSVATLGEVIDLYAAGGRGAGKDSPLKSPLLRPRHFSAQDRADLIAFLKTLTDHQFIRDPRYSAPFPAAPKKS
ncbi:di-heme enzyme [Ideonella dechloratans]|uniref:Di-heme enzyme n=1 Tax=Ideonella dechloratans TaxID=36863 RepID=A0A643FBC7_IDEDE|nr:methanobactin export MATE transporter MbnM [Ideonella dechloratans]KAB0581391.1 di-heme enzyme [Ideonella dechloratans]UFU12355.1 di-heme enzyme [Ideonella dechloratans]